MTLTPVRGRAGQSRLNGLTSVLRSVREIQARGETLLERVPPRLRLPLGVTLLALVGYLLWWAAFYPGLITYDSFDYTWESTTKHWSDDHSVFYISSVWLSLKITGDYALLTFGQVLGMSLAIGYLAAGLRKFRVRTRWTVAAVLLTLVLPSSGDFVVYIWKDVPYVIGAVLGFAALTHIAGDALRAPRARRRDRSNRHGPAWGRRRDWLLLGTGLTLSCLSRNNGFLAVLLAGAAMFLCVPWLWRRIVLATLIPIIIWLGADRGLYPALGVTRPTDYAGNTFFYADIAYTYSKSPQVFSASDLAVLREVAPLEHWRATGANCFTTDALMSGLDQTAAVTHQAQLTDLFFKAVRRAPQDFADATLCRGTPAWAIDPVRDRTYVMSVQSSANGYTFMDDHPAFYASPYYPSMHVRPLSTPLHQAANWWYDLGETPQLNWIIWNGATWCWIGYLVVIRLTRRIRRREVLAVAAVSIGFQLNVLVATPGPLFRYMAAPFFIGVLTLPLAFSRLHIDRPALLATVQPSPQPEADP